MNEGNTVDFQRSIEELLAHLERFLKLSPSTPTWERVLYLYITLTILWAVAAVLLYELFSKTASMVDDTLRVLARRTSEQDSIRLAAVAVQVDAVLKTARPLTGVRIGIASEERDPFPAFFRLGQRTMAAAVGCLGFMFGLLTSLIRGMLRWTTPNAIIWLVVLWYVGWLDPVARRLTTWRWDEIQASQIAAILGLAVIAWAVLVRSDVRGRVEFNKTASVECRKRLLQLRPHLLELIKAEHRVRDIIADELATFPDATTLESITGYHCLRWVNGRVSASECSSLRRHPNLARTPGFKPWHRRYLSREEAYDPKERDAATTEHYDAVKSTLSELREMGYYPKLVDVLPPLGRSALSEFRWSDKWYCGLERLAVDRLSSNLEAVENSFAIRPLWTEAVTTEEVDYARRRTEAVVRKAIRKVRDDLWDGYRESARVAALMNSIGRSQRERLIDRLKQ